MGLRDYLREISLPVYAAVCVFAIASWIDINGVWVELPLLVNQAPEGWNLPSYLIIIIQIANVGPLAFTIAKKLAPTQVREWWVVYLIIGIGVVACLLLVFFWDKTTYVSGVEHSTALLALTAFLALVDCTSSVVFLPYMALYSSQYLTALYVGEGLSGLIPSIIGLIQGVGSDPICVNTTDPASNGTEYIVVATYKPPLFSVSVFFGVLVVLLGLSLLAFTLLHFHPGFRRHRKTLVEFNSPASSGSQELPESPTCHSGEWTASYTSTTHLSDQTDITPAETAQKRKDTSCSSSSATIYGQEETFSVTNRWVITQLVLIGWLNALTNGVLPSIQSYSCLPYGNLAYNLAVRLSVLANPLACFFGLFVQVRSTVVCIILVLIGTALAGYQIALAALSPYPPLYDETIGVVLVVSRLRLVISCF